MASTRELFEGLLKKADIEINGSRPWDIQVHDERLFNRILRYGTMGLGESYMDGWWDCERIDEFIHKILAARLDKLVEINFASILTIAKAFIFNQQSNSHAFEIGEAHYDLGNDLYQAMLDKRMVYSCGYWSGNPPPINLNEAQEAKLNLVCRKLGLKKGDRILDIGCGWGSFAKYAAEKYGTSVVGTTVSKEQVALAKEMCAGLPIEIRIQDYRDLDGKFDHIVSIGMFEHVGVKNYRTYFEVVRRCLKDGGLSLLHTIGDNFTRTSGDPWIEKYIFPNGMLPSIPQIGKATEELFVMEDWHNFGPNYDKTLIKWFENFDSAWPKLQTKYSEKFYRMWKYYLLVCAGTFRARGIQLWQIVLSPSGVPGGYSSVR